MTAPPFIIKTAAETAAREPANDGSLRIARWLAKNWPDMPLPLKTTVGGSVRRVFQSGRATDRWNAWATRHGQPLHNHALQDPDVARDWQALLDLCVRDVPTKRELALQQTASTT